jgi:hypothetical protein
MENNYICEGYMKIVKAVLLSFSLIGACAYGTMDDEWINDLDKANVQALVQFLYKAYDKYKDNKDEFINAMPSHVTPEAYKKLLSEKKEELQKELDLLSYKNVIFSVQGAKKIGLIVAGGVLSKRFPGGWLSYDIDFTNPFLDNNKNRYNLGIDFNYMPGLTAVQAIAGFGLIKDIKAMRDKKKQLSDEIEKCTKMLALLEGAQ